MALENKKTTRNKILRNASIAILALIFALFTVAQAAAGEQVYGYITDSGGSGIANLNVTLNSLNEATYYNYSETNASGFYNVTVDLPATGQYKILIDASATTYDDKNITLLLFDEVNKEYAITMDLAAQGNVSGYIKYSNNTGIPSVSVLVAGPLNYPVTTNANGYYTVNVTTGTYNVTASKTGFTDNTSSNFAVGTDFTTVDLTLNEANDTGLVQGYLVNQNGAGVASKIVTLKTSDSSGTINTTTTDANGLFSFRYTGGSYVLYANPASYAENSTSINIVNGATLNKNLTLQESGTLSGTISSGIGVLSGVLVRAKAGTTLVDSTTTDSNGAYSLLLPVNNYTILTSKTGYTAGSQTISVVFASTTNLNFVMPAITSSSGGGSSGGGSSGGGSFSSSYTPTTTDTTSTTTTTTASSDKSYAVDIVKSKRYDIKLKVGEALKFEILGDDHSVRVDKIENQINQVTFTVQSEPQTVVLTTKASQRVDVSGDGVSDIVLTLNEIDIGGRADITLKVLDTAAAISDSKTTSDEVNLSGSEVDPEKANQTVDEKIIDGEPKNKTMKYIIYAVIAIIVILIIALSRNLGAEARMEKEGKENSKDSKSESSSKSNGKKKQKKK